MQTESPHVGNVVGHFIHIILCVSIDFILLLCLKILLEYGWFIVLVSGVQQSDSIIRIHIFIIFQIFSHIDYYRLLIEFPVLYSRSLLVIYFTHIIVEPLWGDLSPTNRRNIFFSWAETCRSWKKLQIRICHAVVSDLGKVPKFSEVEIPYIWEWHPTVEWFEIKILGLKHFVIRKES